MGRALVARRKEKRVWRRVESRRGGESLEEEEEGAGDVLAPALTNKLGPGERRRRGGWGWGPGGGFESSALLVVSGGQEAASFRLAVGGWGDR